MGEAVTNSFPLSGHDPEQWAVIAGFEKNGQCGDRTADRRRKVPPTVASPFTRQYRSLIKAQKSEWVS